MSQISDRLRGLVQSDIRRMSRECERVGGINLGQGICDLPTIPELVEGACDAIASSKATYSKFEGIDLLRERIARKIERFNGFARSGRDEDFRRGEATIEQYFNGISLNTVGLEEGGARTVDVSELSLGRFSGQVVAETHFV